MIRLINITDAEKLISLRMEVLHDVFDIPAGQDTASLREENLRYYRTHLHDGSHVACVAEVDGNIAGCGAICYHDEMPSPDNTSGRCGYIMNIYVRPCFRRKGVASAIVEHLLADARSRRVDKIYLETTDMAKHLYARHGFTPMEGMMKFNKSRNR